METRQLTVEQAEKKIKEFEEFVKLAETIDVLHKNKDFKLLFDDYTKKEPARLVPLYGDPNICCDAALVTDVTNRIIAISKFMGYLREAYQKADMAEKEIKTLREQLTHFKQGLLNV